jgi:hypothetical protein
MSNEVVFFLTGLFAGLAALERGFPDEATGFFAALAEDFFLLDEDFELIATSGMNH